MKRRKILGLVALLFPVFLFAQKGKNTELNIVFIGNSITQGALLSAPATEAPPVRMVEWLRQQPGMGRIEYSNQGVSGSTTVDFLPASQTLFPKVKQAAADLMQKNPQALLLFSVMLGTNDSAIKGPNGSPVSPQQYYTNVKAIVDELLSIYPKAKFVLHRPVWYSPNTYNGAMYLREGLKRLESYLPQLQSLATAYEQKSPNQVYMGDTDAFDYFKTNYQTDVTPEEGNAGTFYLHPNKKGADQLSKFWGKAIYRAVVK